MAFQKEIKGDEKWNEEINESPGGLQGAHTFESGKCGMRAAKLGEINDVCVVCSISHILGHKRSKCLTGMWTALHAVVEVFQEWCGPAKSLEATLKVIIGPLPRNITLMDKPFAWAFDCLMTWRNLEHAKEHEFRGP